MNHALLNAPARATMWAIGAAVLLAVSAAGAQLPSSPASSPASQGMSPSATRPALDQGKGKMPGMAPGGDEMRSSMMPSMKAMESMTMTGDVDRDFASLMKAHHQGAIDMAREELKRGKDAKLKAMARRIIAAQQKEIAQFDAWLAKHR